MNLKALIPNQAKLARDLGVSVQSVRTWIELDAIPPRRVIAVANALDVEIPELLPYAKEGLQAGQSQGEKPGELNEISHWSKSFHPALAYEIENNLEIHTIKWLKWAEKRHLLLKKTTKWPK